MPRDLPHVNEAPGWPDFLPAGERPRFDPSVRTAAELVAAEHRAEVAAA